MLVSRHPASHGSPGVVAVSEDLVGGGDELWLGVFRQHLVDPGRSVSDARELVAEDVCRALARSQRQLWR